MANLTKASKFLSLVLRHDPAAASIALDPQGWAVVDDMLRGMDQVGLTLTRADLDEIVRTDNKGRYSYSEDRTRIRANQGHSIAVDLGLVEAQPPAVLYHGTARRFAEAINANGIQKMSRQHVHLSEKHATAIEVGRRHGSPVVFFIGAERMYNDGVKFFKSENGVWLTDFVDPKYITELSDG